MSKKIISALTKVKNEEGGYTTVLPITTIEEVLMDINGEETLAEALKGGGVLTESKENVLSVIEDLSSVVNILAGLIDVKLQLNHIYRENFKDNENILKTHGEYFEGGVRAKQGQQIDFKFINSIDLKEKPEKFKVSHISKYLGDPTISCLITFNGKDTSPSWFDCKDVFVHGLFAKVPEISNKEDDKPYSMNIHFTCTCNESSTFEMTDLSILHV